MTTTLAEQYDRECPPMHGTRKTALLALDTDCDGPATRPRFTVHEFVRLSIRDDPSPRGKPEPGQQDGTVAVAVWRCTETGRERVYGAMPDYIDGKGKYEQDYGPLVPSPPRAGERLAYVPRREAVTRNEIVSLMNDEPEAARAIAVKMVKPLFGK